MGLKTKIECQKCKDTGIATTDYIIDYKVNYCCDCEKGKRKNENNPTNH